MIDGFLQRTGSGGYEGKLNIDGVDLSPIEGVYFKNGGDTCLWLKRKPLLEYSIKEEKYLQRPREPRWEAYLTKKGDGLIAYKGEFYFLHFRYSIVGTWDNILGKEKQRLNLMVERLPMNKQVIINSIKNRNEENHESS